MANSESKKSHASRLTAFLGLQRSTVGVLAMVVLVGMGERMAERFLPIYIMALGGSAVAIGLLQAMDNLLSALYSFPGGYLSDRMGTKRALVFFNLVAIAGFGIVVVVPTWQAVLAGAVLFISWSAISLPATMSLIYKVLPRHKRTMGVTMHSLVRRIPMALGPIMGGLFITVWGEKDGVRLAFLAALIMVAAALFLFSALSYRASVKRAERFERGQSFLPNLNPDEIAEILIFDGGTLRYTGSTVNGINRAFTINSGGATIDISQAGTTVHLSRPENYLSIYQSGCNLAVPKALFDFCK